jgi:acetyl-CoA carboxylase carboxyl transferase subunit alpha
MNPNYLDFEQPIADLEAKIQELRHASNGPAVDVDAEVHALQDKLRMRTAQIFRDLSPGRSRSWRATGASVHARLHPHHLR